MWRKLISGVLVVGMMAFLGLAQEVKNPDTIVDVTMGKAATVDPAWSYDTASGEIIFNVYESLIRWPAGVVDGKTRDLSYSLDPADLLPMLAKDWWISPSGRTYIFFIREGVKFHAGGTLTAEDVKYSFLRGMLQDRRGGPQWMMWEPLTGYHSLRALVQDRLGREVADLKTLTPEEQAQIYNEYIDPLIDVCCNMVIFHLPRPYPPFITILAHSGSWSSILDKEWCIDVAGCWDGKPDTWAKWWNPGGGKDASASELYNIANGTGPFKLVRWDPGVEVVFERFDDYWGGPAKVKNVVIKKVNEWSDRLLMFQAGDADICYVDPQYQPQVEGLPGVMNHHHLPTLILSPVAFFVAPVPLEGNDLVGPGPWDGYGIPADFFADIDVRKAFAMAFDYDSFVEEIYLGEGYKTHGPIPQAFAWAYNPDPAIVWNYDIEQAEQLMRKARGGEIWEKGFSLTLLYNEGNEARRVAAEIFEANMEAMNPKFQIEVRAVPWATYLDYLVMGNMPMFIIGWLADYPDPHNFAHPFVHPDGDFAGFQGEYMIEQIFRPIFKPLVEDGMATTDPAKRAQIYYKISELAHEYAVDVWLPQPAGRRNVRDWVRGYPFNPIFPGVYFYPIYKAYD